MEKIILLIFWLRILVKSYLTVSIYLLVSELKTVDFIYLYFISLFYFLFIFLFLDLELEISIILYMTVINYHMSQSHDLVLYKRI